MHPDTAPDRALELSAAPRVAIVIPARYESSRFPGKALADLDGRPVIEHVYRHAAQARGVDDVIVATDDARIAAWVASFGGQVRMTRADHHSGTDRIAEVAATLTHDIVVNVQGDEPLIDPAMIEAVIAPVVRGDAPMATLRKAITEPADVYNPNVVKVVVNAAGDALYFSRATIPVVRDGAAAAGGAPVYFRHIGLYAYRRDFLLTLAALEPTLLERAESLEQLRALEHGFRIRTPETSFDSIGVDTPEDLDRVRRLLHVPAGART